MNNKIIDKVNEIINLIESSPDYKKYISLKNQMSQNPELMELINKVRVLQKDVIHHMKSQEELKKLTDELDNHPLYREYNNTLWELNNTYAIVENSINKYFQDKLN